MMCRRGRFRRTNMTDTNILENKAGNDIVVSPLRIDDDYSTVARLIYGTDAYIYPYLFGEYGEMGQRVITSMIELDTLYNAKNITVAKLDGAIVGMIVSKAHPVVIDRSQMELAYTSNGYQPDEKFEKVYNDYFRLLENEPEGTYIANVCVDPNMRGKRIGRTMLAQFLKPDVEYHLETVKANPAACGLYKSMGFHIDSEYPGFLSVPCYRMSRRASV